ncbi:MAG: glyoxalase [Actinobacteria bacterium]|nr:MAG: glyoxalase [Actinomycetota bacterium]
MNVLFISSFAPIVTDRAATKRLYVDTFGLDLEDADGYLHSEKVEGVRHFGLWPLEQAAEACFGTKEWPADVPRPQASVEFEVDDVAEAAKELEERGYTLLHGARTEPWGQTVARLLSPEGLIVGVSYVPSMR